MPVAKRWCEAAAATRKKEKKRNPQVFTDKKERYRTRSLVFVQRRVHIYFSLLEKISRREEREIGACVRFNMHLWNTHSLEGSYKKGEANRWALVDLYISRNVCWEHGGTVLPSKSSFWQKKLNEIYVSTNLTHLVYILYWIIFSHYLNNFS